MPEFKSRVGTPGRFFPTERKSNEEMERGLGEWRWMTLLDCINVIRNACIEKRQNKQKEWQPPLNQPLVIVGKQESQLSTTVEISPMLGP
jgi:hypothetical protein